MQPRLVSGLAAASTALLAISLAACGAADTEPPQSEAPTAEESDSAQTPTKDAGAEPEKSDPPEESEGDSGSPSPTEIATLWVDDSWTVEEVGDDLCAAGGLSDSIYTEQEDLFTCGPTAASALACATEDGEQVLCITDPVEKFAIAFTSPTAADPGAQRWPAEMEPVPLIVELADGVQCTSLSHDHDQHWNDMFSWFRCEDGSELLTPEYIDATFERGEPWTVQRSVDQGEPEATAVAVATFAGR